MYNLGYLTDIVEKGIKSLSLPEDPQLLYAPIRYTLSSGGKRIRPVLVLAAHNLFSESIDKSINPALALEVFHNFTLIHDDIMDNAALRRNQPTVFNKWGSNVAILSGDAMNIIAYKLIAKTDTSVLPAVLNVFNTIALNVCDGQQLDMDFETNQYVMQEEYLKMIELKTAALIMGALKIGAIIGGASQPDVNNLGEFGKNLGIAFQLQDDLLDSYGETKTFGKVIGGDIVANKKTFLTVKAFSVAKGKNLEMLNCYFKAETIDPIQKVAEVKKIYNELGIKELTEEKIKEYFDKAMNNLNLVKVNNDRKEVLHNLALNVMGRES